MAYDLNGSNQAISYTLNANQTSLNTITISYWVYSDTNGQYRRPFHLGPGYPNSQVTQEMDDGWGMVFVARRTGDPGVWSITKPSNGAWYNYTVTYDNTSTSNDPIVYINGVAQTTTERVTPTGTPNNNSTALYIGSEANTGQYWDGKIAELAMWNRILSAEEVAQIGAKAYSPLFVKRGLVFYENYIRGSKEQVYGLSGTLANSPSVVDHPRIIYPTGYQITPFSSGTTTSTSTTTTSTSSSTTTTRSTSTTTTSTSSSTTTTRSTSTTTTSTSSSTTTTRSTSTTTTSTSSSTTTTSTSSSTSSSTTTTSTSSSTTTTRSTSTTVSVTTSTSTTTTSTSSSTTSSTSSSTTTTSTSSSTTSSTSTTTTSTSSSTTSSTSSSTTTTIAFTTSTSTTTTSTSTTTTSTSTTSTTTTSTSSSSSSSTTYTTPYEFSIDGFDQEQLTEDKGYSIPFDDR